MFGYVGVITMTEDLLKIFTMSPDMKTVPFGNASKCILYLINALRDGIPAYKTTFHYRSTQTFYPILTSIRSTVGSYTFTVADPKLKDLENNMWSSSSRIIVGEKGLQVESRIAKVVSATVM